MGTYTTNLNLYNTNMSTDGNDTFDFQRDINDNNDKIDVAIGKPSTLNTTEKTSLVPAINEVVTNCGALSNLNTTAKNNLVSAINEIKGNVNNLLLDILQTIYSVGSMYFTTASNCPLSLLFGTWEKVGTSIIMTVSSSASTSSTSASVSVRGNGKSLGFTDGTNYAGIRVGSNGNYFIQAFPSFYGANIGEGTASGALSGNSAIGITSDSTKSGLTGSVTIPSLSASISRTQLTVNIFKRIA